MSNTDFFFFWGLGWGTQSGQGKWSFGNTEWKECLGCDVSPLQCVFIRSVYLQPWVGSGVTRLAWPCHPGRGADLLSQRCVLPADDRDWLYANTCRKGWIPVFGKWQHPLKLPAWFNREERAADGHAVPQVEEKTPRRMEMLCLTNLSLQRAAAR